MALAGCGPALPLTRIVIAVAMILAGLLLVRILLFRSYDLLDIDPLRSTSWWLVVGIMAALATHLTYIAFVRLTEQRAASELALRGAALELGSGVVIGGGLLLGTVATLAALGYYRLEATNPWTALIPALGVALFSGYVEEVLSRGVLLRILEEKLGTWLALAKFGRPLRIPALRQSEHEPAWPSRPHHWSRLPPGSRLPADAAPLAGSRSPLRLELRLRGLRTFLHPSWRACSSRS